MSGTTTPSLEEARRRDAADPLRSFRERFAWPVDGAGRPLLYLCGHSLGLAPRSARTLVLEELDDWERIAVAGHHDARRPWIGYHEQFTQGLCAVTGARPHEVVAMNGLTVNLHLLMASFYRPTRERFKILIEAGAFPSDRHAVASQIAWQGLDPADALVELAPPPGENLVSHERIEECVAEHASSLALVLWPGAQYRTGQAFDIARVARAAHAAGAVAGFDLAHAAGNLELALHDSGADFAAWCTYKYLNAGPGAIAGAFVHERHGRDATLPRLSGWWGHDAATRFRMGPEFLAQPGAAGWQLSNPPILSAAPLLASLRLFQEAGIAPLRAKSVALGAWALELLRPLAPAVTIVTPADPAARGAQLSLRIVGGPGRGRRVFDLLGAGGTICDWREPDVIRLSLAPLYNSYEDAWTFVQRLGAAVGSTA